MRAALDRFSLLLVGWIPDLSRIPLRRQVAVGAMASLLLHGVIFLGFVAAAIVFPKHEERLPAPEQPNQIELVIQPSAPAPQPVPAMVQHRQLLDPRGLKASEEKPHDADFESDRDMRAGSAQPASGLLPLPSQQGVTDRQSTDFADQDVQLNATASGSTAARSDPIPATSPSLAQKPTEREPTPSVPPPLYRPVPVSKDDLAKSAQAPPEKAVPEPAIAARATPPPLEKVTTPSEHQIVVAKLEEPIIHRLQDEPAPPKPTPPPQIQKPEKAWAAYVPPPRPASPSTAGPEELKKTLVEGAITNHGPPGVDAVATPTGRWWMQTKNAIAQNWYLFTDQSRDRVTRGTVRIDFAIDAEGKVHNVRVGSKDANSVLVEVCLRAIRETPIPIPPPDIMEPYQDHKMDNSITFNYY